MLPFSLLFQTFEVWFSTLYGAFKWVGFCGYRMNNLNRLIGCSIDSHLTILIPNVFILGYSAQLAYNSSLRLWKLLKHHPSAHFLMSEPPEQVLPEIDNFISLLLHMTCVTSVRNFDDCCSAGWSQKSLLELDLVQKKLIGFLRRQVILLLHGKESFSGDWLWTILDKSTDELVGC